MGDELIQIGANVPKYISVEDVTYKLYLDGNLKKKSFRISYAGFDGNFTNWEYRLFDTHYKIGEDPSSSEAREEQLEKYGFECDANTYVDSVESLIEDFKTKLSTVEYEELSEVVTKETKFYRELTALINRYSLENESNTPDFLLAQYLIGCLRNFSNIVNNREEWYGRGPVHKEINEAI